MNLRQSRGFVLMLCPYISEVVSAQGTRLLRHPTVSRDSVAFEYAETYGSSAQRRTSAPAYFDTRCRA